MPRPWHQSRPPTSRRGRVAEGIAVDPTAAATRRLGHINPAIYVPMQGPSELGLSGTLEDWDRSRDLAGIDVPALVIGATHDTMDPEHMRWMAEQLPQRRYLHCPDGSHLSQFDDPQHYFPGLLDFLRSL